MGSIGGSTKKDNGATGGSRYQNMTWMERGSLRPYVLAPVPGQRVLMRGVPCATPTPDGVYGHFMCSCTLQNYILCSSQSNGSDSASSVPVWGQSILLQSIPQCTGPAKLIQGLRYYLGNGKKNAVTTGLWIAAQMLLSHGGKWDSYLSYLQKISVNRFRLPISSMS